YWWPAAGDNQLQVIQLGGAPTAALNANVIAVTVGGMSANDLGRLLTPRDQRPSVAPVASTTADRRRHALRRHPHRPVGVWVIAPVSMKQGSPTAKLAQALLAASGVRTLRRGRLHWLRRQHWQCAAERRADQVHRDPTACKAGPSYPPEALMWPNCT